MSLIRVNGLNPFSGQSDPYITMDSSVSYNDGPQGTIQNSYSLDGVITGCSVQELTTRRDALVKSFDWKADTGIINNIEIIGVVSADAEAQILPTSLSFESSTYIGALSYSLSLEIFTGFGDRQDESDLVNKTHTESTSINEDGCITINTTIGAEPNSNLSHCKAVETANSWISGRLGATKLGQITRQSTYEILNESLDINPLTSSMSYSRSESNCSNGANTADGGLTGLHFAYCIDSNTDQGSCALADQVVTQSYQGEVYGTGYSMEELVTEIKTRLFPTTDGITTFKATYNEDQSNVTFSASRQTDGSGNPISVPQDVVVNNYTLSTTTDYNRGGGALSLGSVNGRVYIENPRQKSPLSVNTEFDPTRMIELARGVTSGPTALSQQNVTYDNIKGGISYSYGFSEINSPNDENPQLDGISGLTSYTVAYTPSIRQYETVPSMNCEDFIFDLGYASRASINITVTAASGSGYNFETVASEKGQDLLNSIASNRSATQVEVENTIVDGEIATYNYNASYGADSATSESSVLYL